MRKFSVAILYDGSVEKFYAVHKNDHRNMTAEYDSETMMMSAPADAPAVPATFTEAFIETRLRSMRAAFLHPQNITYLTWHIDVKNTADGAPIARALIAHETPVAAQRYADTNDLDDTQSLTFNWLESLDFVNSRFIETTYAAWGGGGWTNHAFERGAPEPDTDVMLGTIAGKRAEDVYVDDIRALDAYNYRKTFRDDATVFRNGNKIRGWERQLCVRNYDRDNTEGLRDTRDLEQPQRGYDMSAIHAIATTYSVPVAQRVPAIKRAPGYGLSYHQDSSTFD